MEPSAEDLAVREVISPVISAFRDHYQGLVITNGGYDKGKAQDILASGKADLVSFGKLFIANPDLPQRFATDAPLNTLDMATVYGKGEQNLERGYTDYPMME
jgi:N-ethylmaleimide reductase